MPVQAETLKRMIRERIANERLVSGLRTRFFPKSRINQGLVSMAPWLNIILLIIMFGYLERKVVLQPGVVLDLPTASLNDGLPMDLIMVIRSEPFPRGKARERAYFDDSQFLLSDTNDKIKLTNLFQRKMKEGKHRFLTIYADSELSHGTMLNVYKMAESVGIEKVNLALQYPSVKASDGDK